MTKQMSTIHTSTIRQSKRLIRLKKKATKANSGLVPYINADYVCLTCGNVGLSHPETSNCFVCDTDNWHPLDEATVQRLPGEKIKIQRFVPLAPTGF